MGTAGDLAALGPLLYERLRSLLLAPGETDEDLAYLLGTPVRDVTRLKTGFGPNQVKLLGLLEVAGWLTPTDELSGEEAKERAALYQASRRAKRLGGQG